MIESEYYGGARAQAVGGGDDYTLGFPASPHDRFISFAPSAAGFVLTMPDTTFPGFVNGGPYWWIHNEVGSGNSITIGDGFSSVFVTPGKVRLCMLIDRSADPGGGGSLGKWTFPELTVVAQVAGS